jgi:prepilin-type N-terminal cleavage/methylation domain-containing protein
VKREQGLTLIELMVVVAIVGILATLAVFMFTRQTRTARRSEVHAVMAEIQMRQEQFHLENGRYMDIGATTTDRYNGEQNGEWIPDGVGAHNPGGDPRQFTIAGAHATWATLRVAIDKPSLYCSYTTVAGSPSDPTSTPATEVSPTVRAAPFGFDVGDANGDGLAVPNNNWYYIIALCDFNGDDTNAVFVKVSNRDKVASDNTDE